jgi:DNA-binding CsgD family transcriptional regulator
VTRGCGNDPRTVLSDGDAQAVAAFRAYLTARKTVADYEAAPRPVPADADRMTPAQLALLTAVAHGVTQQQLTRRFGVSHPAVSKQLRAARRWLGAETVAHAVFLATRAGLIPDAVGGAVTPVVASEAPGPRRDAAGRSGDEGAGFNGAAL